MASGDVMMMLYVTHVDEDGYVGRPQPQPLPFSFYAQKDRNQFIRLEKFLADMSTEFAQAPPPSDQSVLFGQIFLVLLNRSWFRATIASPSASAFIEVQHPSH